MGALLAVDAGVRTGLALLDGQGFLLWYRSHNLGTTTRLRKAARNIVGALPKLELVVVEGGGSVAKIWYQVAHGQGIPVQFIQAQDWRQDFLLPRDQHRGAQAKAAACALVQAIVQVEGPGSPTMVNHDAAEAVLIGFWAAVQLGWRTTLPKVL